MIFFFVSVVTESGKYDLRVIRNKRDLLAVVHQNGVHSYFLKSHLHFSSIFFPCRAFSQRFNIWPPHKILLSASSKQVQSLSYPLVYKSNTVSPRGQPEYWSSLQGCQNSAQFNVVLKQIVPLGARQRTCRPCIPSCELYWLYLTAVYYCPHTKLLCREHFAVQS